VGGGWYLLDEYRTNLTGLNEDEIRTLFVANSLQLLGDLGLQRAAEDALTKLLAALPGRHQQSAELVRQRIHVDGTRWHATGEDLSWLSMLQEAIWAECKIELSYKRSDGETVTRQVDPLGLVAKGNVWYLITQIDPPDAEGWQVVHITCETEAEALAYVLGCGPRAQVIDPPSQREKVIQSVTQMAGGLGIGDW
jgi:predicted DNA-binding transcriptional regulator YafY